MDELETLRLQINEVTVDIFRLIKKRLELARSIGRIKALKGLPIKDEEAERRLLYTVRKTCEDLKIFPEFGEALAKLLIKYSIKVQEESVN